MKIAFVWQGISERMKRDPKSKHTGRYGLWDDGLRAAMRIIENKHTVTYHEPSDDITDVDIIMYWESPCTIKGPNATHWLKVVNNPIKKVLLFSGGPIEQEWLEPFAHTFVESKINLEEIEDMGLPVSTAFGVNTDYFTPLVGGPVRIYDAMHHATSASWKRQPLLAEALKDKALIVGRFQPEDPFPFNESERLGAKVIPEEVEPYFLNIFLNKSWTLGQTANFWGGGQRATLEALAAGVPVIAMKDSPKNCEYVVESGCGLCVDPDPMNIRRAVEEIKKWDETKRISGRHYVMSKWTAKHYADNLLKVIETL